MSAPGQAPPPRFNTTFELQQYQMEQARKAEQQRALEAQDRASFDAARAQFRQTQADAASKGKTLTSQTYVVNESGEGFVQSNFENAARTINQNPNYVFDAGQGSRAIDLSPRIAQQQASRSTQQIASDEYANPNYNLYFGSQRIGDIINQEVAKGNKGLYAPRTEYDYNDVKAYLAGYEPAQTSKRYTVNLYDSISGQKPEKYGPANPFETGSYEVKINDVIGLNDKPKPLPSNPITGAVWQGQNDLEDFLLGAYGTGIGIGSIFTGLSGKGLSDYTKSQLNTKGSEVIKLERPSLIAGVSESVISRASGNSKAFDPLVSDVQTAPLFFAGSAATTAAELIGPGFIAKGLGAAKGGIEALFQGGKSEKIASFLTKDLGYAGDFGSQAFKIGKTGEAPLSKFGPVFLQNKQVGKIPFMIESKVSKIEKIPGIDIYGEKLDIGGIGSKGVSVKVPTSPDQFSINISTKETTQDIGLFSLKNDRGAIFSPTPSAEEKAMLLGKSYVTGVKEATQNEAEIFPKIGTFISIREGRATSTPIVKASGGLAKIAEERPLGYSTIEFSPTKVLQASSKAEKSAVKDILNIGQNISKPQRPSDFTSPLLPKAEATSRAPLQSISEYNFDAELLKASVGVTGKAASGASRSSGVAAGLLSGLGLNAKAYGVNTTSLGFGGATGAERKRSTAQEFEYSYDVYATPKASQSQAKKLLSSLDVVFPSSTKNAENIMQSTEKELSSIMSTGQGEKTMFSSLFAGIQSERSIFGVSSASAQSSRSIEAQSNKSILDTRTEFTFKNEFGNTGFPRFPEGAFSLGPIKPRKKKAKKSKYHKKTSTTADIIRGAGFTKADSRRFQRMFGKF